MIIFEEVIIKNCQYSFFNDMININNFDPNLLSINKILLKSTDSIIVNIKYNTMKNFNHVNINNENPPYLIFNNVDG